MERFHVYRRTVMTVEPILWPRGLNRAKSRPAWGVSPRNHPPKRAAGSPACRGDLEPLAQEVGERLRQRGDILQHDVVREGEGVHVLGESGRPALEGHRLQLEQRVLPLRVQRDEHQQHPRGVRHGADAALERLLLVEVTVRQHQHQLLQVAPAPPRPPRPRPLQQPLQRQQQLRHWGVRQGVVLLESEVRDEVGPLLVGEGVPEGVDGAHVARLPEAHHPHLPHLQTGHGAAQQRHRLQRDVPTPPLRHRPRVVDRQHHLVLAGAGLGAAQPDLVLAEVGGDVGDDLLHVQPLASAVVPLQLGGQRGLQHQPQLLRQLHRQAVGQRLVPLPHVAAARAVRLAQCVPLGRPRPPPLQLRLHVLPHLDELLLGQRSGELRLRLPSPGGHQPYGALDVLRLLRQVLL
eukprot:1180006-Prorocentrum_minimum.AAC.4